ncbi:MAG: hypothetical protein WDM79_09550 [Terricaulis sp.]
MSADFVTLMAASVFFICVGAWFLLRAKVLTGRMAAITGATERGATWNSYLFTFRFGGAMGIAVGIALFLGLLFGAIRVVS